MKSKWFQNKKISSKIWNRKIERKERRGDRLLNSLLKKNSPSMSSTPQRETKYYSAPPNNNHCIFVSSPSTNMKMPFRKTINNSGGGDSNSNSTSISKERRRRNKRNESINKRLYSAGGNYKNVNMQNRMNSPSVTNQSYLFIPSNKSILKLNSSSTSIISNEDSLIANHILIDHDAM